MEEKDMSKIKVYQVDKKERYRIVGELFEVICNLKTKQEVIDFLVGLITSSEALMLARRLQIAKMLIDEKGYDEIRKKLKVSHQTIAVVEKWVRDENKSKTIIRKIAELNRTKGKNNFYHERLLDKYPQHRFLKDIFD